MKYLYIIFVILLSGSCGRSRPIPFINSEGKHYETFKNQNLGVKVTLNYLYDDINAYGHEVNYEDYYQQLLRTYYINIQTTWDKKNPIVNMNLILKDVESGIIYPEDVVYFEQQFPLVKFDAFHDYVESKYFEPYKSVDIIWNEKNLRKCNRAVAEIDVTYLKNGKKENLHFQTKEMIRQSRYSESFFGCN